MTTTPDAPVAVEQCDRETAADIVSGFNRHILESSIRTGVQDHHSIVQRVARHRLAALASAPAERIEDREALTPAQLDAVVSALAFVTAGDWEETSHGHRIAVYERAFDKLAALRSRMVRAVASAPAGDGVEKAAHILARVPVLAMVGKCGWKNYEQAAAGLQSVIAALARPRAAVGEREA